MAYGKTAPTSSFGGGNRSNNAPRPTSTTNKAPTKKVIFSTGLFAPTKEGVKSIGSVQVKEDVTIPAGSYINLYENDKRDKETSPMFKLSVTEGKFKQVAF